MRSRAIAGLLGACLFLAAGFAWGFTSHPEISVQRFFLPALARPGQAVKVSLQVDLGAIGADPLRGFYLSDHLPLGFTPENESVMLDGSGIAVSRDSEPADTVIAGCTTERWVLETPWAWQEELPLVASSTLVISYDITVPADAQPGFISFPGFTWVGMISNQGAEGNHFGYEDVAASIEVLPGGDDWDGDGMPNDWESDNGFNPDDPNDANGDPDGDGLPNLVEYQIGTDPNNPDTDGDTLPDGWEHSYTLNPLLDDADQDFDGDTYSNLEEYLAGTDPTDPDSHPGGTNHPPSAGASADPASGDTPLTVQFSGLGQDPDGTVVGYAWDFGDTSSSTEQSPLYVYQNTGTYVARLTVTDDQGDTGTDTVTIRVFEPPDTDGGQDAGSDAGADALTDAGADSEDGGIDPGTDDDQQPPGMLKGSCSCGGKTASPGSLLLLIGIVLAAIGRRCRYSGW